MRTRTLSPFTLLPLALLPLTLLSFTFRPTILRPLALALLVAGPALAASTERPVLVELFTSQGCSSCPPADALMADLAARDDVVALSFHVDYWDRLGWPDTLADPAFTDRQRRYARARGDGQVYTPQIVVSGAAHAVGSDRADVEDMIAASATVIAVDCKAQGDRLAVDLKGVRAVQGARVWLATFDIANEVAIPRGENGGETLRYTHSVRGLTEIGQWNGGSERLTTAFPRLAENQGAAVFVQAPDGRVLGADYVSR